MIVLLFFMNLISVGKVDAATIYKGILEDVIYSSENQNGKSNSESIPTQIVIKSNNGTKVTLNIDQHTNYFINNTLTTIEGFKKGMTVEATVSLRKVTDLKGTVNSNQGTIPKNSKEKTGVVTEISSKGTFIRVKLDHDTESKTFYINKNTKIRKGESIASLGALNEGDRVILKFSSATSSVVSELDIAVDGVKIKNIYRGKIQSVNPYSNSIVLNNLEMYDNRTGVFKNTSRFYELKTFTFESENPIFVGKEKVSASDLKSYKNSMVYFVTTEKNGEEMAERMVVISNAGWTFREQITAVNPSYRFINLKINGRVYLHEGTIIISNGQLIDRTSLIPNYAINLVIVDELITGDYYAQLINLN